MSRTLNVGVVGATGLVGEIFLQLLDQRKFPVGQLRLFASDRSKGQTRLFRNKSVPIETPSAERFKGLDLVFFSSGDDISREWAPEAVKAGAFAIDNSAAFRMDPDKLLCVPEVNGHLLPKPGHPALIANPNCSTISWLWLCARCSKLLASNPFMWRPTKPSAGPVRRAKRNSVLNLRPGPKTSPSPLHKLFHIVLR